jgi:hypothetical protein
MYKNKNTKSYISCDSKLVYDGIDGYVYSELCDLKSLYSSQYMTYSPSDDDLISFMNHLESAYKLAEQFFDLKIVLIDQQKQIFITKCPKYDGDLNYLFNKSNIKIDEVQIMDKIIDMIKYLKSNGLVHYDFAFRNICYKISENNEITLHLIDFEQLCKYNEEVDNAYIRKEIKYTMTYLLNDIDMTQSLGCETEKYFKENLYKKIC